LDKKPEKTDEQEIAVYIGDTITCTVTFTEKDIEKRLFHANASSANQDGVEMLQAKFSGFPVKVRLAR
jgi:3-hydroxybutyryl-CoA dehydratase